MVSPEGGDPEIKNSAEYSLEQIRSLAQRGMVRYGSRTVMRDVENLSYAPEDVHQCLQTLNQCHFQQSLRYAPGGPWLDVYHITYNVPTGENAPTGDVDDLYIKLKLDRDCVVVILASFHRKRL